MRIVRRLWIWGMMFLLLCGCTQGEEPIKTPSLSVTDTMKQYLDALIAQDGMTMANLTIEDSGFDFTITDADAQELGMDTDTARKLYKQLLTFNYKLEPETVNGDQAEILVHISTYDLNQVLTDIVEAHKEEFAEIYDQELEEEEKNQEIASIIVDAVAQESRSYNFDVTFHLQLIDQVWLIDNADEQSLFQAFFQQE